MDIHPPPPALTPAAPPTTRTEPGPPPPVNRLATASMILGIVALVTSCVGVGSIIGLVALVLGIVAISQTAATDRFRGRGHAIAGTTMGGIAVIMLPIVALLIGILLPGLGAARRTARQMQNSTQFRGVHQGMILYAQGNRGHYPGVDSSGNVVDATVEGRLQVMLDNNYFTGEYLINPAEKLTAWQQGAALSSQNYSYAALDISDPGDRRYEWRETLNADAVVLSDRNLGNAADVYSVWTEPGGGWRGTILWNDSHVSFESTHVVATDYRGGQGGGNPSDDLFTAAGADDAMMIHSGQ